MSVLEIVDLRVKSEISDVQFCAAAEAANGFLKTCPGFIRRRLGKRDDGSWIDMVEWASMEEALAAAKLFNGREDTKAFNSAIVPGSVTMRHFTTHVAEG